MIPNKSNRRSDRVKVFYEKIADLIVQVTIGAAATALLVLPERADPWDRVPYLAAIVLNAMIPWATYRRGSSVAGGPNTFCDHLFPLLMLLSIVLAIGTASAPRLFREVWFGLVSFNALCAVGIISTRLKFASKEWLSDRLKPEDLRKYASWLEVDRWGAAVVSLWTFGVCVAIATYGRSFTLAGLSVDIALISACALGVLSVFITCKAIADENYLIRSRII